MGRKKQIRPHRSGGILENNNASGELKDKSPSETEKNEGADVDKPFFVEIDRSSWILDEHFDISEILLMNLKVSTEFYGYNLSEDLYHKQENSLRFRLGNMNGHIARIRLGHWPVLETSNISLELVKKLSVEDTETCIVILTGNFDGPDEGVSGLVHLVSMNFFTLRPIMGPTLSDSLSSMRVRVEILKSTFDACDSLLDNTRQLWKKSMMNVMAWLRPEVVTSEVRYGYSIPADRDIDSCPDSGEDSSVMRKGARFDVAGFYVAVKPRKDAPMLENHFPNLLPDLRPYQRRAAYWMVNQEKGASLCMDISGKTHFAHPLCTPVSFIETCSGMFYNSFSGSVSLHPEPPLPYIFGGILADEMGLGKTVELLACIFAHQMSALELRSISEDVIHVNEADKINIKRTKRERVECVCGAVTESIRYKGLWVQCDICDAWQHADCVGYSAKGKASDSSEGSGEQGFGHKKKRAQIVETDGTHICPLCSELIQAVDSPVPTGATLIVCPAPILPQWHSEIIRHTNPGSLKTCVYEGVRNSSNTSVMDIGELLSADIVLTTYDVLKEDLFHDSDRHEGDRRLMRFQKRYPVIPTPLTRIFWWRICLDEAQMAENNAAAATEMALRLHAKHRWCVTGTPIQRKLDDLYGLLRFLQTSPFDVHRWWADVIRDPYEKGDAGAMTFTHDFFKKIMWRSSKAHVAEELQIPPQEETLSWLCFSPIEAHFYQRQHETCVAYVREVMHSFKEDFLKKKVAGLYTSQIPQPVPVNPQVNYVTSIQNKGSEAAKLLNSLLKLRQACCHPQVGSSGLRSLQQSPMTMEDILSVLVGKTKVEGEEALRKLIVALNGLAAISVIKQDFTQAVSLYKEALTSSEEHSEDFRLDPLLNIHIHHNLSEILPLTSNHTQRVQSKVTSSQNPKTNARVFVDVEECDQRPSKRTKVSGEDNINMTVVSGPLANGLCGNKNCEVNSCAQCLRLMCENLKQKFLSVFNTRLSVAQQDFSKSYEQINEGLKDRENQHTTWWLEALDHIEENNDTASELMRKIREAVSRTLNTKRPARIASSFRCITTLKYYIETGLDSLEDSRKNLLDRLLEIDQSMVNPRDEDIERVRFCPNCQAIGDGPLCVHCELDELFQLYEARLFRLNKGNDGGVITSAEEAVDLQKKKSALNRFYWNLSQTDRNSASSSMQYEDDGKKRDAGEKVTVSKSPSELEVVLGIIKGSSKALLGRESMSKATKQLLLLEGMRKEYAQARSLAIAQAQVLRAHDEIKMATSRLRLRENENDKSIDALGEEELDIASVENSSEKFIALTSLLRIKGQLRYLKGLVQSKQNQHPESTNNSTLSERVTENAKSTNEGDMDNSASTSKEREIGGAIKADEESCPVCHEKLSDQKMVFQCGHVTCCHCFFAMSEQREVHQGKFQSKWVMCPTCRQHTDFGNVAFVDDRKNKSRSTSLDGEKTETSITVQGSYSTKIEAVTRRILWIKSENPKSKVLVFSSWNDVLDVLEHAFTANNISFVRMKGGRKAHVAISHFKSDISNVSRSGNGKPKTEGVQVLLLLIQHGANGLNLLEAQHVILVEPLLNPAVEAQAISRVHRIGQRNKTLVHRFIVKDTVEESLYKLNKSRNTSSFIGNKKNQDEPIFTLKDVESLFKVASSTIIENGEKPTEGLMHLPPSVAAVTAAERRLREHT